MENLIKILFVLFIPVCLFFSYRLFKRLVDLVRKTKKFTEVTEGGNPTRGHKFLVELEIDQPLEHKVLDWATKFGYKKHKSTSDNTSVFIKKSTFLMPRYISIKSQKKSILIEGWVQNLDVAHPLLSKENRYAFVPRKKLKLELEALIAQLGYDLDMLACQTCPVILNKS